MTTTTTTTITTTTTTITTTITTTDLIDGECAVELMSNAESRGEDFLFVCSH